MGLPYVREHHDGHEIHLQASDKNIWFHTKKYNTDDGGDYDCISVAIPKDQAQSLARFLNKHAKMKRETPG